MVDVTPVMPKVEINRCKPRAPVTVPLVDSWIATAQGSPNYVRHVTFDVSGTPLEGQIHAGQSFGIVPPGRDADGKPHRLRLFSTSSPSGGEDGKARYFSTVVKRVLEEYGERHRLYLGVASNFLCDLQQGDTVQMTGPAGKRFLLPTEPERYNYVFFATGTGIAPFRAMLLDLIRQRVSAPRIHLIVGVPYRTDCLYHELFTGRARELPGFRYRTVVSREDRRMDGFKHYVHHEIGDDERLRKTLAQPNTLVYICGIRNMEFAIYRELLKADLGDYIALRHPPEGKSPLAFSDAEFVRHVRPGPRLFLEVY